MRSGASPASRAASPRLSRDPGATNCDIHLVQYMCDNAIARARTRLRAGPIPHAARARLGAATRLPRSVAAPRLPNLSALAKLATTFPSYTPSLHRLEYYDPSATSSVSLRPIAS
jgi:hypothetical protein